MPLSFDTIFATLPSTFYTKMSGEVITDNPYLLHFNPELCELIGLENSFFDDMKSLDYFIGKNTFPGSDSLAMVYAGHQFGQYVPQLGDGRALLLGQIIGMDGKHYDLQVKGAGLTPYSRMGDGRAVLRSSIREYICGEAMYQLGISSTRALGIIATNRPVIRERIEPGAIIVRIAESHIRFGHFEYFHYRNDYKNVAILANHVIEHYYTNITSTKNRYVEWFQEITARTATLIAKWQAVGFCHGVMNTDNMSILGLTLDYGPFGFLETYNPTWICNQSDHSGRYSYQNQPIIAQWNLYALAHALQSVIPIHQGLEVVADFDRLFKKSYEHEMAQKLGFNTPNASINLLWQRLLTLMQHASSDYTLTFSDLLITDKFLTHFKDKEQATQWIDTYEKLINEEKKNGNTFTPKNPRYVFRNWIAEKTIRAVEDNVDLSIISEILTMLNSPFEKQEKYEQYASKAPEQWQNLNISCSS